MPVVIPVAHDFVCPWCWIGWVQARRLAARWDVGFDWRGYELYPDELAFPEPGAPASADPDRPPTPSRLALAYAAEGMAPPAVRPPWPMRTHAAHEAVELAKLHGTADALVDRLYRAYWEAGLAIGEEAVVLRLAAGLVPEPELREALRTRRFADRIVGFDDPAYASGVYNVPTFSIGARRLAEAPTVDLEAALAEAGVPRRTIVYPDLRFPAPPADRPYVAIDMVTTVDGKILTGRRDEPVMDLGSALDHATMRHLERSVDAVMLGAGSLRATPNLWYPAETARYVVTARGVPTTGRFFTDAPDRAWIVGPETLPDHPGAQILRAGKRRADLRRILRTLRQDHGVRTLLVEGGAELNAQLLRADLVDELFLTLAPKVKLGRSVPTYAGGTPLPRERVQRWELVSETRVEDEVFLRYRRPRKA